MIAKGTRIKQYEIVAQLGAGGMGHVYLAEDRSLGRKVAMKFLPPDLAADEQAGKRLLREARAAAVLDHPNVCAIHEVGEEGNLRFIVLQYIEGETLASRLKQGPIEPQKALPFALQIAEALVEAHGKGILHRDIKPENIMLTSRDQVKVLDFGLAKRMEDESGSESEMETASALTVPGIVLGTLPYMSPEQVRGESLDTRSDIFSFGALLYHLFSGKGPFTAKSKAEITSNILTHNPMPLPTPTGFPDLNQLIGKCLEKDKERRYPTMKDVHTDLDRIRREYETSGGRRSRFDQKTTERVSVSTGRRVPRPAVITAFVLLTGIVAGVFYWMSISHSRVPPPAGNEPVSSPAYRYYVRGKVKVSENREENEEAIRLLEQAVAADSRFAPAYAELARGSILRASYYSPGEEKKLLEDAEVNINIALDLKPDLAEAHYARGLLLWTKARRFQHELAIRSLKRALALDPKLDEAHHQLAAVYYHIGLMDKAREEVEESLAINPDNTMARFRLGPIFLYGGKYQEAFSLLNSVPPDKVPPPLWQRVMASTLFQLHHTKESAQLIESTLKEYPADEGGAMTSMKAILLAQAGKKEEAERTIQKAIEIGKDFVHFHHTAYNVACAYALLHEPEKAVHWLQQAANDGFPCYPLFVSDPTLNNVRRDEQFLAFMAQQKSQWKHFQTLP